MKVIRYKSLFSGILLIVAGATAFAQPDSLWSHTYGGAEWDWFFFAEQTADGGYINAGETGSFGAGGYDFWLVRTDANGAPLWSRTYGGSEYERCHSAAATSDGGYVLAGDTRSFGLGDYDIWLLKVNSDGDSLWSRTFGGTESDRCLCVQQTSDGGYILAGETSSFDVDRGDLWIVRTNSQGDSLWSNAFGGVEWDGCTSAEQTSDGGYILAGWTRSFGAGNHDFWLVKTDENGDSLWSRTFGGADDDYCHCVHQTADGGYVLTGQTWSFGPGWHDFWLVRTDANGDSLWSRTYGGDLSEFCYCAWPTSDGGYVLVGQTQSFGAGNFDVWLVRVSSDGTQLWDRTFGGSESDGCFDVRSTSDGGYVLAGYTHSFGTPDPYMPDSWLVKTGPDPLAAEPKVTVLPAACSIHQNYPNPFNPSTQISYYLPKMSQVRLCVYDLLGREVRLFADEIQAAGDHSVMFDGTLLPSGIYVYRLRAGDFIEARKMVLLK